MWEFITEQAIHIAYGLLLLVQLFVVVFNGGIPNIRTAPAIRARVIDYLKKESAGKASFTVLDLGSGNGLFTREIAKALPHANVVGLEISRSALAWARRLGKGLTNLSYVETDLRKYDFSKAQAVVMYMVPEMMKSISEKFRDEAPPGAVLFSNRFQLRNGWEPVETMKVKTIYFHQGEFYVYRKA